MRLPPVCLLCLTSFGVRFSALDSMLVKKNLALSTAGCFYLSIQYNTAPSQLLIDTGYLSLEARSTKSGRQYPPIYPHPHPLLLTLAKASGWLQQTLDSSHW
ncbi:hypothetical protein F4680DRAFT_363177 [Xylaria scruposa]|nr:hypothetical protein F4680DRAFT_363177 [Xylaria scruposa]